MKLPKRPRQHQVEDLSVQAFQALMPEEWVVREKSHDYGIDLEVEIFDNKGYATGLLFYVQLKATDSEDQKKQDTISFSIGHLHYYNSLRYPVLIARFSEKSKSFHFKWSFEVYLLDLPDDQKSTTIHFLPKATWLDYSPEGLHHTVTTIIESDRFGPRDELPLIINTEKENGTISAARARRIIRQSLPEQNFHVCAAGETRPFALVVELRADEIFLSLNGLFPTTIETPKIKQDNLTLCFAYAVGAFLTRTKLITHNKVWVGNILVRRLKSWNTLIAAKCAMAFHEDLQRALDLVILNNIQTSISPAYMVFSSYLLNAPVPSEVSSPVMIALNETMLQSLTGNPPDNVLASLHYNIGNACRPIGQYKRALTEYNRARILDSDYLNRPYFHFEVGAILFDSRKYHCSAKAYQKYVSMVETDHYFLADALLQSGQFKKAIENFKKVDKALLSIHAAYASVKIEVAHWLTHFTETDSFTRKRSEASLAIERIKDWESKSTKTELLYILKNLDPLEPTAAFNLAVTLSREMKFMEAFFLFVIQTLYNPYDGEAWANAFACAMNEKSIPTEFLMLLLMLANHFAADSFNDNWDAMAKANERPQEFQDKFDELQDELSNFQKEWDRSSPPKIRISGQEIILEEG